MSIGSVESSNSPYLPSPNATNSASAADKDLFMQLMVTQMRYQDPLNPSDSSEFLAQTAQFTALEKMTAIAEQTAALSLSQAAFGATNLIGKNITYTSEDGSSATGSVASVEFNSQGPLLVVDGNKVPLGSVTGVSPETQQPQL